MKLTSNAPENGWLEDEFPFGARPTFKGELLVSGRVFLQLHPWRLETQDFCLSKATCSSEAALRTENLAHLWFFSTNPRHSMGLVLGICVFVRCFGIRSFGPMVFLNESPFFI